MIGRKIRTMNYNMLDQTAPVNTWEILVFFLLSSNVLLYESQGVYAVQVRELLIPVASQGSLSGHPIGVDVLSLSCDILGRTPAITVIS